MACPAATLDLKTEKTNAHGDWIRSVAFSPDGMKIVSGSDDCTIKVWDVANPRPYNASEWESIEGVFPGTLPWRDQTPITYWKNAITGDLRRENSSAGAVSPRTDQSLGFGEFGCVCKMARIPSA